MVVTVEVVDHVLLQRLGQHQRTGAGIAVRQPRSRARP